MKPKVKRFKDLPDFGTTCEQIYAFLKKNWKNFEGIRPKGYEEIAEDYTDYEGMEELDESAIEDAFEGHDDGTAGSFPFPIKMSAPHVVYDDKCQGRDPMEVFIGAVLGHGMMRGELYGKQEYVEHELMWIEFAIGRIFRILRDEDPQDVLNKLENWNKLIVRPQKKRIVVENYCRGKIKKWTSAISRCCFKQRSTM